MPNLAGRAIEGAPSLGRRVIDVGRGGSGHIISNGGGEVPELTVGVEVEAFGLQAGEGPRAMARLRCSQREPFSSGDPAVLPLDPDPRLSLVPGTGRGIGRGVGEGGGREGEGLGVVTAEDVTGQDPGGGRRHQRRHRGDPSADVDVGEGHHLDEFGWGHRIDVGSVGEAGEHHGLGVEQLDQVRGAAAGLFVLPLTGQVGGYLDPIDEGLGVQVVELVIGEGRVADPFQEGLGLEPEVLVAVTDRVAAGDPVPHPTPGPGSRAVLTVRRPFVGEAVVEDPARVQDAGVGVRIGRQRRDGPQVRRLGSCHVELAVPGVGDAGHPYVSVGPALAGQELHQVVAVGGLEVLHELEGSPRTPGTPHVDADHHVALGHVQQGLRGRVTGLGGVIARVVDQHRPGPCPRPDREVHVHRQLGAVPGRQVSVPGVDRVGGGLVVVPGVTRMILGVGHLQTGNGIRTARHPVVGTRRHLAEQERPGRVGDTGCHLVTIVVDKPYVPARRQTGGVHLVHAPSGHQRTGRHR